MIIHKFSINKPNWMWRKLSIFLFFFFIFIWWLMMMMTKWMTLNEFSIHFDTFIHHIWFSSWFISLSGQCFVRNNNHYINLMILIRERMNKWKKRWYKLCYSFGWPHHFPKWSQKENEQAQEWTTTKKK